MNSLVEVRMAHQGGSLEGLTILPAFEAEDPTATAPGVWRAGAELAGRRPGFRGAEKQRTEAAAAEAVLVLHGLGPRAAFDERKLASWLSRLLDELRLAEAEEAVVWLPDHPVCRGVAAAERTLRRLALGRYVYDPFKSEREPALPRRVAVRPPTGEEDTYRQALEVAPTLAAGVAFARDLANSPANLATPAWMEEQARTLAHERGCDLTVLDAAELANRGMRGILSVGQGSAQPPRLVRLEWGHRGPVVALVGKGVTFDTGGISIKPAQNMEDMKFDKSGACTVLGVFHAVTALDLPVRLRGYLPLAENMPDGASYRPSDILRCYNGKTVEVVNTDAEGRLLLADALAFAAEEDPDTIVEFSTLTGACVVALGFHGAGLFSPDDKLAAGLLAAAEASGERLWRLPLWPEFSEEMKGNHGDLKNSGGRGGGPATAAAFLAHFVGDHRSWAHLDIAGPAQEPAEGAKASGATGYGVPLAVHFLRALAN
jgi:leucyl aminopeptidase